MKAAAPHELLSWLVPFIQIPDQTPQKMKEYDPEWARASCAGTLTAGCDHARMLSSVKVPVLFTHHFHQMDESTGRLMGVMSDAQAARVRDLVTSTGNRFDYQSHPTIGHSMHGQDPALFAQTLIEWVTSLEAS